MKKLLLAGVAVAALFGGSAVAADMGAPVYKAPPPAPVFTWAGWYFGTHTGAAIGLTTTKNLTPFGGFDAGIPLSYEVNPVSIFGGGQIGYNWQFGAIVLGAEIDGGYLGARESQRPAPDDLVEVKYTWYGTVTGRAGLAYDRLLPYLKGAPWWRRSATPPPTSTATARSIGATSARSARRAGAGPSAADSGHTPSMPNAGP